MFGRAVTQMAVVNTAGVAHHTLATEASGSLTATVDEGTSHWIDLHRSAGALGIEQAIERTVRESIAGRGRGPLADGHYTVVLGPQAAGELIGFLPDFGFAGELAAAGVGLLSSPGPGTQVAAPMVTVADDALAVHGLPIGFDLEGTPKSRVALLDRRLPGATPVGQRGPDDHPRGPVRVDVPEHVRRGDHGQSDLPGGERIDLERQQIMQEHK